jgi:hypothetical protein
VLNHQNPNDIKRFTVRIEDQTDISVRPQNYEHFSARKGQS